MLCGGLGANRYHSDCYRVRQLSKAEQFFQVLQEADTTGALQNVASILESSIVEPIINKQPLGFSTSDIDPDVSVLEALEGLNSMSLDD